MSTSITERVLRAAALASSLLLAGCGDSDSPAEESMGGFQLVTGLPTVQALGAVWSFGPNDVWLTADGGRVLHFDGEAWTPTQLGTQEMMLGIWAFAPDDVWMVGGVTLARYDGAAWTVTDLSAQDAGIEGLSAIWGSSPTDVWVVGSQSTAAHWDGSSWHRYIAAGTENAAVWGSGPSDVYVSGTFDLAHWDGSAWATVEAEALYGGTEGIWGSGPDDVWVASGSDRVARFDGSAWTTYELDTVAEASALWGRAANDIWGVGTPGGILHYDGSAWSEVAHQEIGSPYLRMFHGVHGSEQGDVWIVGTELGEQGAVPQLYRR
ncbi:MAG: hypothetical protein IT372_14025 [Polyangiaceae bacterium]|nr:hypothetical protein [Polyangiaceae bacterium]